MKELTARQLKAVEMLAQGDDKTYQDIARDLNIQYSTLLKWRKREDFAKAVRDRAYELLREQLPYVYSTLDRISKEGDTKAISIFLDHLERIENDVAQADGQITFTWKRRDEQDD